MKNKKKRSRRLISVWSLTMIILAIWVGGMFLGVWITDFINNNLVADDEVRDFLIVLAFITGSACLSVPIIYFSSRFGTKILNSFIEAVNKISEGDFSVQISPIGKNEPLNNLIHNFNNMIKQLDSTAVLRNDFVSSFSHEFKTPMVSIKGYAELLESSKNLTAEQQEYVSVILDESKRLSKLAENILLLSKLDRQNFILDKSKFYLDGQIENVVLLFDNSLKEKNIEVETNLKRVRINSSPDFIKEVWINLLSNAIKYSKQNGKIKITLENLGDYVEVSVCDNGIGMSEETLSKAFERFYQKSKNGHKDGLGLGLTIVKRIVDLAEGEISCTSQENVGTQVVVKLPKN